MVQHTLTFRLRRRIARGAERVLLRVGLVESRFTPDVAVVPEPVRETPPSPQPPGPPSVAGSGDALTHDAVQEMFDDMVRPALQADGGDITLVSVQDNDVTVRLVGACSSCPSATLTMKDGIERLLREEFPEFGELIQVDADGASVGA